MRDLKLDVKPKLVNLACGGCFSEEMTNFDFNSSSRFVQQVNLLAPLPLATSSVDGVYCSHFVEHIPIDMVAEFLAECRRILKPGSHIRIVVPDFEEICREYLKQRTADNHQFADFAILAFIDQYVRSQPGGKLGKFYRSLEAQDGKEAHALRDYVALRTGHQVNDTIQAGSAHPTSVFNALFRGPDWIWASLYRAYCGVVTTLLPAAYKAQNISNTNIGEKHAWVYDFHTMSQFLKQAGFSHVKKMSHSTTNIIGLPIALLDMNADRSPRKGSESMFVEGVSI